MRSVPALILVLIVVAACGGAEPPAEKPLSVDGEKLYDVRGKVLSRDEQANTLQMDHEAIPGFMEAMVMDYAVRGAKVAELPANGTRVQAKLHVTGTSYWLTDVKPAP